MKILLCFLISLFLFSCTYSKKEPTQPKLNNKEMEAKVFLDDLNKKASELFKIYNLAEWDAYTVGTEDVFKELSKHKFAYEKFYANKEVFSKLKEYKENKDIRDPIIKRQIEVFYNGFVAKQFPEALLAKIIDFESKSTKQFSTYRSKVDGKEITSGDVYKVLGSSTNSDERQKYWESQKQVAESVAPLLTQVVKLRNQSAQNLGYKNFYEMKLLNDEQNPEDVLKLFDELYEMTKDEFAKAKKEIDEALAKKFNIDKDEIMPWHYEDPYFQKAPSIYEINLDKYFDKTDILKKAKEYYLGIGFDVEDIIARSDLYEKKGKSQHAFCFDIDRVGDIRVLLNLRNNKKWAATTFHELGHGVYWKYVDRSLPWIIRDVSHTLTTEAIAMLFEDFPTNPWWMEKILNITKEDKDKLIPIVRSMQKNAELIFTHWSQVMVRFEMALYENPDQDLTKLWWDLKEKYQLIKKPLGRYKPDYAAKVHFVSAPVYYQNYTMGNLMKAQIMSYIAKNICKEPIEKVTFIENKEVGKYFKEKIFFPGGTLAWDDLIKFATGEKLTPKYFAERIKKNDKVAHN